MMFLKKVMGMVSEVSLNEVKSPDYAVQDGEKVVGILPDDLKRLYAVMLGAEAKTRALHERLEKELPELDDKVTEEKKKQVIQEHAIVHLEEDLITKAFWTNVRLEFPQLCGEDCGVRKDWQVVRIDQKLKAKKALSDLLEHIFL